MYCGPLMEFSLKLLIDERYSPSYSRISWGFKTVGAGVGNGEEVDDGEGVCEGEGEALGEDEGDVVGVGEGEGEGWGFSGKVSQ